MRRSSERNSECGPTLGTGLAYHIAFSRVVIALPQFRQRFRLTIPSFRRRV